MRWCLSFFTILRHFSPLLGNKLSNSAHLPRLCLCGRRRSGDFLHAKALLEKNGPCYGRQAIIHSPCTTATRQEVAQKQSLPSFQGGASLFANHSSAPAVLIKRKISIQKMIVCVHYLLTICNNCLDLTLLGPIFHARYFLCVQVSNLAAGLNTKVLSPGSNLLFVKISRKRTWPY